MNTSKILGILLIAAGALGATYGGFSYTRETHAANLGPLHVQVLEQQRVNIPMWAGIGAIGVGLVLLLAGSRKA